MKHAQDALKLAQEVKERKLQEQSIKNILDSIDRVIQHTAQQGNTDVKVFSEEMAFDTNFPLTIGNLKVIGERVHAYGYSVSILMLQQTADMVLHINWQPHPMDMLFKDLGAILDPESRF